MLESSSLRYFRTVAESGSIKQAASLLRIASSAVSRQVQALEDELSAKLFERGAKGMQLTAAGHALYRYAAQNRGQIESLRSLVSEFDSQGRGHVRLATVEGLMGSFVTDFLVDVSRSHPGISVTLNVLGSRAIAEAVCNGDADLGLVFGRAPRRELTELIRMQQSLCLIVSPNHPFAAKSICSMKDLAGLRVVLPDASFGIRQEIDKACTQANMKLEIVSETNSLAYAQSIVSKTSLATFLPEDTARPRILAGLLAAIPIDNKRLESTQVTLVQFAARTASTTTRLFAQLLVERMSRNSL